MRIDVHSIPKRYETGPLLSYTVAWVLWHHVLLAIHGASRFHPFTVQRDDGRHRNAWLLLSLDIRVSVMLLDCSAI